LKHVVKQWKLHFNFPESEEEESSPHTYIGVQFREILNGKPYKWDARIKIAKKGGRGIGHCSTAKEAAQARDNKLRELIKENITPDDDHIAKYGWSFNFPQPSTELPKLSSVPSLPKAFRNET